MQFAAGIGICALLCCARLAFAQQSIAPANPAIDAAAYLRVANDAVRHRETHRLSEEQFIRYSREPGTVILDARSRQKYDLLHVRGALNLSFPDIAIASVEQLLPDKDARILIYCNNNFSNAQDPFPSKLPSASLNLSTYVALYDYGYRNVYELGPLIDARTTRIPFESSPR
jgi:phage shock protein E